MLNSYENISTSELELLLFKTKKEILNLMSNPKERINQLTSSDKAFLQDHFIQFQNIWQRHLIAQSNGLLNESFLEQIITTGTEGVKNELLGKVYKNVTINIKNMISNSQVTSQGNLYIGDQTNSLE